MKIRFVLPFLALAADFAPGAGQNERQWRSCIASMVCRGIGTWLLWQRLGCGCGSCCCSLVLRRRPAVLRPVEPTCWPPAAASPRAALAQLLRAPCCRRHCGFKPLLPQVSRARAVCCAPGLLRSPAAASRAAAASGPQLRLRRLSGHIA